jgi:hypothetical protein
MRAVWEAADVQWWWRRSRASDLFHLPVWFDEMSVAMLGFTKWARSWQGDARLGATT